MSEKSRPAGRPGVVDAVLDVVAEHGLERATVRQVAAEAGVAIGTVQHWFPTKDDLLAGAFEDVVARVRDRVDGALVRRHEPTARLREVLGELLPLDAVRRREARVLVAFAARAAVEPRLARLQRAVLHDVRTALAEGFAAALGLPASSEECTARAAAALALADGLALHAVSSGAHDPPAALVTTLDRGLDALLGAPTTA